MGDRSYRRERDADSDNDRDTDRERERRRRQQRQQRKKAHTSTDSSAELLASSKRNRASKDYRDSPSTSPEKRDYYRDQPSSPEKSRRYRRGADESDSSDDHKERHRRERRTKDRRRSDVVEVVEYVSEEDKQTRPKRDDTTDERRQRRRRRASDAARQPERDAAHSARRHSARPERRTESASRATPSSGGGKTLTLSADGLAALDALNEKLGYESAPRRQRAQAESDIVARRLEKAARREERRRRRRREGEAAGREEEEKEKEKGPDVYDEYLRREKRYEVDYVDGSEKKKGRVVSGQRLEKGGGAGREERSRGAGLLGMWPFGKQKRRRGGRSEYSELSADERALRKRRRRKTLIILGMFIVILAIAVAVGVAVSKKEAEQGSNAGGTAATGKPANTNLNGVDPNSVPQSLKGSWMDPFSWYDTTDFNVTFTSDTVGGLPIIGLMSAWDDSARANDRVPALNDKWEYGSMPMRGINVGGWFVNEPLITPSFYSKFKTSDGVVDEWTLAAKLPPASVKTTFETHYAGFITERDFLAIQQAGFDHVRIPFGYWAVTTYQGDPYVAQVSWRYLLRAIEWARKYGLRVNLDLHGAPGSQNGWNHSGKQGQIGWLNGTDGALNGQRTIQIHDQLSKFFAQPRYANIIAVWGLVNEPKMTVLDTATVVQWTRDAVATVRGNGIKAIIAFGDGFMGLDNWQGKLADEPGLVLDVHQYVIFNVQQLVLDHRAKVNFACGGWTAQATRSMNRATGFGPTIFAEWSQADTDCAQYLNNVGVGSRWEGTLNFAGGQGGSVVGTSVLSPTCPTANNPRCSCSEANADPGSYSPAYKQWLRDFAEAQMYSFEQGWGWFYWTWKTETNTQWSYSDGLRAGILPSKTWDRTFTCNGSIPDYAGMGLAEYY